MQRLDDAREAFGERAQQAEEPRRGADAFDLSRHPLPGICGDRPREHRRASLSSRVRDGVREADDDREEGEHVP